MDSRSHRRTNRGITLLEMVSVMAIVAILMTIAIPSYKYVTNSNRIAAEVNGLLGDMQFARSEAIKEGQTATVCVSSNGTSCSVGSTTWQSGWIVFSDVNGSQTVDPGDTILRVQSTFLGTDTFTANQAISAVSFNREGFASANGGGLTNGTALITLHAQTPIAATTRCLAVNTIGLMAVQTVENSGGTCL
jgi:type IV fimbrial biogenesis protein FimT